MLVFAYGSLLWHPGFQPKDSVRSTVHRGTHQSPGAVLGQVEGGRCSGLL